jgi:hypothetical protein
MLTATHDDLIGLAAAGTPGHADKPGTQMSWTAVPPKDLQQLKAPLR